jgi:elongation factor G
MGDAIAMSNRRRGKIEIGVVTARFLKINACSFNGDVRYASALPNTLKWSGTFSMEFLTYLPCPKNIEEGVIEESRKKKTRTNRDYHIDFDSQWISHLLRVF